MASYLRRNLKLDLQGRFYGLYGPEHFLDKVQKTGVYQGKLTDKFSFHKYQTMYGLFLYNYITRAHRKQRKVKMLEIGFGCPMPVPGLSAHMWRKAFPDPNTTEIWFAEGSEECMAKPHIQELVRTLNVRYVVGLQEDMPTLRRWVKTTGGGFDIIIDDGGHQGNQINNSFHELFPRALAPGGLYFIEDLDQASDVVAMLQDWMGQLAHRPRGGERYPIPRGIKWMACQAEACVLAKCYEDDIAICSPQT